MTFLLDVNVLIALMDTLHVSHDVAHIWFEREGRFHWATCPIVENGLVRIISNRHEFWHDDLSISDALHIHRANLLTPGQITDTYLLALCVNNGGRLATFDRRFATLGVRNGEGHLCVINSSP